MILCLAAVKQQGTFFKVLFEWHLIRFKKSEEIINLCKSLKGNTKVVSKNRNNNL